MTNQRFKYQRELEHLEALGYEMPPLYAPGNMEACRFASSKPGFPNHIPQYMSNPKRMLHDIASDRANTSLLALSCFDTTSKAEKFFKALLKSNQKAALSIGDSLSEGNISNQDGEVTRPAPNGHFDLYEYENCDLNKTFKITKQL